VGVAALAGGAVRGLAPAEEPTGAGPAFSPPILDRITALVDPPEGRGVLMGLLGLLGGLGAAILVIGWLRGFL
jgi:hypothetical protein